MDTESEHGRANRHDKRKAENLSQLQKCILGFRKEEKEKWVRERREKHLL